jgi:cell division control protein 6
MAWDTGGNAIILDSDALSEEYLPHRISRREDQADRLRSCLAPALRNGKPLNVWLHGRPGTGKTATALALAHEVSAESKAEYVHVNCRKNNSLYSILDRILNELRVGFGNERDTRVKLERIERHIRDRPLIVILDEIDFLTPNERSSLLYNLSFGKVGLVCISERPDALISLNGRTKSRLQPQMIEFEAYTPEEIGDILRERVFLGLAPESCDRKALEKIALFAEGDARTAIQTLRTAAEFAEQQGSRVISLDHIQRAFSNTKDIKRAFLLERLGGHYTLLYNLIQGAGKGGILSTGLWDLYLKECGAQALEPLAKRTYSYYLNRMVLLKLIEARRARLRGHVFEFSVKEEA